MSQVTAKIKSLYESLPKSEKKVADFILKNAATYELRVLVYPYYLDGDTQLVRALITTIDYQGELVNEYLSEDAIQTITITDGVTCSNVSLDGDGDGALEGGNDYNQNNVPDDWVVLTNGVDF